MFLLLPLRTGLNTLVHVRLLDSAERVGPSEFKKENVSEVKCVSCITNHFSLYSLTFTH